MEKETLVAVVKRSQAGDPTAQEKLILEVQQSVYYQCLKFLHHQENAQDATQDILISMLTKLNTLNQPEAFWGWLNRMTANHCKNLLRKTGELQIPEDEEGNSLLDTYETLDEQMVPDKALDNEETRRMVIEMIDALPAPQRMCVIMYYYNEMSVKDIAAALEVSENTIKSRLNYARKAIKEGAESYKKQGIKLYSLSPLPFLLYFLLKDADASALGAEACQAMAGSVLTAVEGTVAASSATTAASSAAGSATGSSGGAAAAASAAEGTAAKTGLIAAVKGASLTTKIVAGALSAAVVFGGGGLLLSTAPDNNEPPAEPSPIVSVEPQSTPELEPSASVEPQPAPESEPSASVVPQHPFIRQIDSYDTFYANLVDLDGDGTEELLIGTLVDLTTVYSPPDAPNFSEYFPIMLCAYWLDGRMVTLSYTVAPDEEECPEEWAIYRHTSTDDLWFGQHFVRDYVEPGFGPEYWFSRASYPFETEPGVMQVHASTFDRRDNGFFYCPPGSNTLREVTEAEYNSLLAEFEVLIPLPFSRTTNNFTQFYHTVDEVRQQLENAAN